MRQLRRGVIRILGIMGVMLATPVHAAQLQDADSKAPLPPTSKSRVPGKPIARPAPPPSVTPVVPAAASVVATSGQVLYIGVDNPVTVHVPGTAPADIELTASCPFTGAAGEYLFRPAGGTTCTVAVGVRSAGMLVPAGDPTTFTVRRVPDPVAHVGTLKADGVMTRAELQNQSGLSARIENFSFDVKFTVVSFVLTMNINGVYVEKLASGPGMTAEMRSMLGAAKPGQRVLFEQVTVRGPDGSQRRVPGVVVKVK